MSQLIVARFNDQVAAASAVSKLLANGVSREQIAIEVHASFIDAPHDTPAPTSPIPVQRASENSTHRGGTTDDAITPRIDVAPEKMGHSVVSVIVGSLSADQLRAVLEGDGASSVECSDGELPASNVAARRGTTKAGHSVTEVDRQRAIDASRGGSALDKALAGGHIDSLARVEKSPAQQADDQQIKPDDAS